jgi:hypothetical protein
MSEVARACCDVSCRVVSVEFTQASNDFEEDVRFITTLFEPFPTTKPISFMGFT